MRHGRFAIAAIVLAAVAVLGHPLAGPASASTGTAERDPFFRPFAPTSIWNMPIGAHAQYVPSGYPVYETAGIDRSIIAKASEDDPVRQVVRPHRWDDRCNATAGEATGSTRIPDHLVVADAGNGETPNNNGGVLQPDGRTFVNIGVICRDVPGGPVYGWVGAQSDIVDGDGRAGSHGGSYLSALGGAIRPGELISDEPIAHALDLVMYARHAYMDGADTETCYVWPAYRCDAYAAEDGTYEGDNPAFRMGALLAIPPSLDPADIGVTTPVGRKLFAALRDYGGYFTDDSYWEANYLVIDSAATADMQAFTSEVRAEFGRLLAAAHVVANNGPDSVGGGGTPRRPLLAPAGAGAAGSSGQPATTTTTAPAPSGTPTAAGGSGPTPAAAPGPDGRADTPAVQISETPQWRLVDRFEDTATPWRFSGAGSFSIDGGVLAARGETGRPLATLDVGGRDVDITTTMSVPVSGAGGGIALNVVDDENLVVVSVVAAGSEPRLVVTVRRSGVDEQLAAIAATGLRSGERFELTATSVDGRIVAAVNGAVVLEHHLPASHRHALSSATEAGLQASLTSGSASVRWFDVAIR